MGKDNFPNIHGTSNSLVYDGYTAGTHYTESAGEANIICLPNVPQYHSEAISNAANSMVNLALMHGPTSHSLCILYMSEDSMYKSKELALVRMVHEATNTLRSPLISITTLTWNLRSL